MSAEYIKKIRTKDGDKQIDYTALANLPESLKNPNALTFTGDVSATYDGSAPVSVKILQPVPKPTINDARKSVIVNQNGDGYELGDVRVDAYTKSESDGRYAPISAAIRPTANGNPAVCSDSVAWPFQGLKIYGKSTQDGTPSPENPVPIVSAGETAEIKIGLYSENLFNVKSCIGFSGFNGNILDDDFIYAKYDNSNSANQKEITLFTPVLDLPNQQEFRIVAEISEVSGISTFYLTNGNIPAQSQFEGVTLVQASQGIGTFEFLVKTSKYARETSSVGLRMVAVVRPGTIGSIKARVSILPPNLNFASYEPFKNLFSIIFTPSGLPGIPVDSGGNYTDGTGKAYASDYWDFGNGHQHILCGEIASYNGEEITTPYISTTGALTTGARVLYVLPEPRTEPIPAEIMAAYRALATYDGTTVVSTAEPVAGIEARYVANGAKVIESIESRLAAIESSAQYVLYKDLGTAYDDGVNSV